MISKSSHLGAEVFSVSFVLLLLSPIYCFAQDSLDVKGGFFQRDTVKQGVFGNNNISDSSGEKSSAQPNSLDPKELQKMQEMFKSTQKEFEVERERQKKLHSEQSNESHKKEKQAVSKPELNGNETADVFKQTKSVIDRAKGTHPTARQDLKMKQQLDYYKKVIKDSSNKLQSPSKKKTESQAGFESPKAEQSTYSEDLAKLNAMLERGRVDDSGGYENGGEAVLSLIVSADPYSHFVKHLKKFAQTHTKQSVEIGNITVIGFSESTALISSGADKMSRAEEKRRLAKLEAMQSGSAEEFDSIEVAREFGTNPSASFKIMNQIGLTDVVPVIEGGGILSRYGVETSPVWIVRYKGKEHVFEGGYNPQQLFNRNGEFLREEPDFSSKKEEGSSIRHKVVGGGMKFSKVEPKDYGEKSSVVMLKQRKVSQPEGLSDSLKVSIPTLPNCTHGKVRRMEVYHSTAFATRIFDIVYYSETDSTQVASAKKYSGRSLVYHSGGTYDPSDENSDPWQIIPVGMGLRCLPTLMHFAFDGSKRFLEFREGEEAWVAGH